jgi:hypothetical protein
MGFQLTNDLLIKVQAPQRMRGGRERETGESENERREEERDG